jgi:predicted porin
MKNTLLATASAIGLSAVMLPGLARADSVSDLQMQMQIIESQIKTLQAHSSSMSASSVAQLHEVEQEVSQMKVQLDEVKAQPPAAPATAVGAYPYPGLPAAAPGTGVAVNAGTGPVEPKVIKPLVGGILLYAGNGSAFFIDGTLDGGIRDDLGAGHSTFAVQEGAARASRLALEGYQNIGFGLRAVGVLEAGLQINTGTGANNPAGITGFDFGRESYAGIGNDEFGYIDFGRQYSPLWATVASPTADPFGGNWLGGIVALNPSLAVNSRVSNAIIYNYNYTWEGMIDPAPSHGLGFAAMYAPGQNHGDTTGTVATAHYPVSNGQQLGAMVSYGTKLFFVDAGYNQIDGYNSTDAPYAANYIPAYPFYKTALKEFSTAGSLLTPVGRVFAQIGTEYDGRNKATMDAIDQTYWFVGFAAPTFKHQLLRFSYGSLYNHDATYKGKTKEAEYSIAQASYEYDLVQVPGTCLYIDGLVIDNNKYSAQGILGAADSGTSSTWLLPTQLTTDDGAPDYGGTGESLAMGIRYIF